ncbi:hypothetical protein A2334_01035 [Candidatus Roizmanbacteria bacterium RIFOXYB2_FULL_38_10]|uniref:NadR/Ttd14 AAA domain-containing protein n=1 Tax=Candidatus Roizmanbacteria bacterium RIFOXYD1_FULL_38_12 TaxID=1802093 RepID=A0A1F7L1P5_9BACT|nr:MAG: hypothetical protein A3K47_04330 [Candidatus Roizmanbacteria bacterium RIFOXYA2_FULL_38_14]OGK63981.1 MAG: hypothetical protein A3K27_04330 [Candidatus Roizmanbacteria bacterium RIFOXYA1_FULL_37_12]OGK65827.1 MAG: hypothetical protein A3K38_04330 [Candidatus Roizmanbacteria bacterium RIFOXYB1_FULL_40_23]OGK68935.1 MAG: hypothetical protein A2334_01035 [Candidatus Roizmanbacteria bacterium RIFOXYB2_FULL_38_10]OGK70232.1 MAG: hypothetical protein A3K21_04335 [Candidatus Roizmanbacteria ba
MSQTKLYIIAGPQSSGKTTVWQYLHDTHPSWNFIPEINQYVLKGKDHMGGAFVTADLEAEITKQEIKHIASLKRDGKTHVSETGIFHLVYLEHYCGKKAAVESLPQYMTSYKGFEPHVLFIDTKPQTSWERRRLIYERRLDKAGIKNTKERSMALTKYKTLMEELYPLWKKYYNIFPLKKIRISNSYANIARFKKDVIKSFLSF